jgi:hypothetical protein
LSYPFDQARHATGVSGSCLFVIELPSVREEAGRTGDKLRIENVSGATLVDAPQDLVTSEEPE